MPKGFHNFNLNKRDPQRRLPPGAPLRPQSTGFRPSHEKNRPPKWAPTDPPNPQEPVKKGETPPAPPEKKK